MVQNAGTRGPWKLDREARESLLHIGTKETIIGATFCNSLLNSSPTKADTVSEQEIQNSSMEAGSEHQVTGERNVVG